MDWIPGLNYEWSTTIHLSLCFLTVVTMCQLLHTHATTPPSPWCSLSSYTVSQNKLFLKMLFFRCFAIEWERTYPVHTYKPTFVNVLHSAFILTIGQDSLYLSKAKTTIQQVDFSEKGQMESILVFMGHTDLLASIQVCHWAMRTDIEIEQMGTAVFQFTKGSWIGRHALWPMVAKPNSRAVIWHLFPLFPLWVRTYLQQLFLP